MVKYLQNPQTDVKGRPIVMIYGEKKTKYEHIRFLSDRDVILSFDFMVTLVVHHYQLFSVTKKRFV